MGGASTRLHEYSGVCIKLLKVLDPTLTLTVPPWPRPLSSPSVSANSGPAGLAGGRYHSRPSTGSCQKGATARQSSTAPGFTAALPDEGPEVAQHAGQGR